MPAQKTVKESTAAPTMTTRQHRLLFKYFNKEALVKSTMVDTTKAPEKVKTDFSAEPETIPSSEKNLKRLKTKSLTQPC